MLALHAARPTALGLVDESLGLQALDEGELSSIDGGGLIGGALLVAGTLGAGFLIGVAVGALVYILIN